MQAGPGEGMDRHDGCSGPPKSVDALFFLEALWSVEATCMHTRSAMHGINLITLGSMEVGRRLCGRGLRDGPTPKPVGSSACSTSQCCSICSYQADPSYAQVSKVGSGPLFYIWNEAPVDPPGHTSHAASPTNITSLILLDWRHRH